MTVGPAGSGNNPCPERVFLTGRRAGDSNKAFPSRPSKLTFSSAETSAIVGGGVGARFFTKSSTSRRQRRPSSWLPRSSITWPNGGQRTQGQSSGGPPRGRPSQELMQACATGLPAREQLPGCGRNPAVGHTGPVAREAYTAQPREPCKEQVEILQNVLVSMGCFLRLESWPPPSELSTWRVVRPRARGWPAPRPRLWT